MIEPVELSPPPQPSSPKDGNEWQHWFFQLQQAAGMLAQLQVTNTFQELFALSLDGTRFAGQAYSGGNTIQAAVNAAGSTGSVIIPAQYAGTDDYQNENNIPIIDLRHDQLGVWSWIAPSYPVKSAVLGKFPLGNDMVVMSRGPADTYVSKQPAMCATASNLIIGANTVTVGAVTVANDRQGTTVTGDLNLFSDDAGIFVGRGTANEEAIAPANWTRNSATSISLTCALAHTGPVDIEQSGTFFVTSPEIVLDGKSTSPPNATFNRMPIYDSDRNLIGYLPYLPDAWPYSGVAFNAYLTGANGANSDLNFRMANSSSTVRAYDDTAGFILFEITNAGRLNIRLGLTTGEKDYVVATTDPWVNGAGASAGTLGNAPAAGNPTKWLPFDDNGTIRHVPAW